MVKHIALALPIKELAVNGYLPEICAKYPGANWLLHFHKICSEAGISVQSAEVMAQILNTAEIKAEDIAVIREEDADDHGLEKAGAKVIDFCLESPMYNPGWYSKEGGTRLSLLNGAINFPSFEELPDEVPKSSEREGLVCMVASNKQWWTHSRHFWGNPHYREAIKNELHGERLKVIEHFAKLDGFKLFGRDWDKLAVLPQYQGALEAVQKLNPQPVQNKHETLTKFKFTFCYENTSLPGYCTEKVIDALVAGCIPIYLGDPYMERHSGTLYLAYKPCYMIQDLNNHVDLYSGRYLDQLQKVGKEWLEKNGHKFKYSYFAKKMFERIEALD